MLLKDAKKKAELAYSYIDCLVGAHYKGDMTIPAYLGKNYMTPYKLIISISEDEKAGTYELHMRAQDLLVRIEGKLIGSLVVPFVGSFSYYVDKEWHYLEDVWAPMLPRYAKPFMPEEFPSSSGIYDDPPSVN